MEIKKYQIQANRTLSDLGEKMNLAHMVLGIHSELSEWMDAEDNEDRVNIAEELIDQVWYIANYCTIRGYDLNELFENTVNNDTFLSTNPQIVKLEWFSSNLQDIVKKYIVYNKPIDREKEIYYLGGLLVVIYNEFVGHNITFEEALDRNIAKLKARFPDKFTEEAALNRDLKKERQILEGNATI